MSRPQDAQPPFDELIECVADEFVAAWLAKELPRIEDYLQKLPAELAEAGLRELLCVDLELRRRVAGEQFGADSYVSRFPAHRSLIDAIFIEMDTAGGDDSLESTSDGQGTLFSGDGSASVPQQVGRFVIERVLGKGSFGRVYCARDAQLDRLVAIKGPSPRYWNKLKDELRARFKEEGVSRIINEFLDEARKAAGLKHPGLVTVYDFQLEDDRPYIVQEFIEGSDLGTWSRENSPDYQRVASLMLEVAEALSYAHQQGFVHRDLKPANVLIDREGRPHIADFGLAIHESVQVERGGEVTGTLPYMSPEQIRGESHRLDGRSDLWSWGVMFYELLVGRRPFEGPPGNLITLIEESDPWPPRQRRRDLPDELGRICLKCLEKKRSDRYDSAAALIDDLRHWLDGPHTPDRPNILEGSTPVGRAPEQQVRIVPKGLRSFDEHDADFFLELLPGPRDRNGLPESIRFWKTRIEETDPDRTFSVGLIYGPSGCGKSSLVKAGLLPRLALHVIPVYVEATPGETELRLLRQLRKHFSGLPHVSLRESLLWLREGGIGRDRKVLIILDQFEQWLHAQELHEDSQLVPGLRQCDGCAVQCLVMVRDDFQVAVNRFFQSLEVRQVEGHNVALVDLFDVDHARKVLKEFGIAYGKLPPEPTPEQFAFLNKAVDGLAEERRVVSVQVAVFAEMMKIRPWTEEGLREVGGTEGVGVKFLEEMFNAKAAPPARRVHHEAVQRVLMDLLPEHGGEIKGQMRSYDQLLVTSGYADRPRDFDALLQILTGEVRLVTPTEPDEKAIAGGLADRGKYYQLTHDYLVPSLREWLTRKRRATRRGRAEMRLSELAANWNAKPERRHLPSVVEWLNISLLTRRQKRTEIERRMLRSASRLHSFRAALLVFVIGVFAVQRYVSRQQYLIASTATVVDALQTSIGVAVYFSLRDLERLPRELVIAELHRRYETARGQRKLTVAYALAQLGEVDHRFLVATVPTAGSDECPNIARALRHSSYAALEALTDAIASADDSEDWTAKARLAVVSLLLGEPEPAADMLRFEDRPDPIQRTVFVETFPEWHCDLQQLAKPVRDTNDHGLRSGMCLAVGSIDDVGEPARGIWQKVFEEWYINQPDTGTHSAAGWALRNWNVELPPIQPDSYREAGKDWRITPSGLTLLRIPAGEFMRMAERPDDRVPENSFEQTVRLRRDFYLCDREITIGLFQQFMDDAEYTGAKPESWKGGVDEEYNPTADHPARHVNWYDAVKFCNWLSQREGHVPCYEGTTKNVDYRGRETDHNSWRLLDAANGYRLPSEAQWEYASRAGTTTRFAHGESDAYLDGYGIYTFNSNLRTAVCGSKMCNAWGLFDMHGNLVEWCGDWYAERYESDPLLNDPTGPSSGTLRVARGGSWGNHAQYCHSSHRYSAQPDSVEYQSGFRVARVLAASERAVSGAGSEGQ